MSTSLPAPLGTPYRIAFVCLGNICRSPMADVVMTDLLDQAGLSDAVEITSSGTGDWHIGKPMDDRAAAHLAAAGFDPTRHRAEQFDRDWLNRDLVLAMDQANLRDILAVAGDRIDPERVKLFRAFDPEADGDEDVPDPYWGGEDHFAEVLTMVERTCRALLGHLEDLA